MASAAVLHQSSRPLPTLLLCARFMGGGPRTFPGGINKWQYKRMHEKFARDKERRLLHQEKQLYLTRLRSEIRAKVAAGPGPSPSTSASRFAPMSSKEHIKALADRFMKEGAEDLWNDDDGPLCTTTVERSPSEVAGRAQNFHTRGAFHQRRQYSTIPPRRSLNQMRLKPKQRWNSSSEDGQEESDTECKWKSGFRIPRFNNGLTDSEEEGEMPRSRRYEVRKKMMSSAGLMNHDPPKTRRVPKLDMEDRDLLECTREEFKRKVMFKGDDSDKQLGMERESLFSGMSFADFNISQPSIKALDAAGYMQMTVVQEASLPVCLDGKDALVKARTGTGKSIAFLLPAIEMVLRSTNANTNYRVPPILVLVLCPTRELAIQLAAEAKVLLQYHDCICVQTLIGGTRFKVDQKLLESNPCQIIIATPGRLLDHIENKSGFSARLMSLKLLVLDEADHLLDLGFRKDIEKIVDCMPRQRQSLLFSATIPKEVRRISQLVLKKEHVFIDTVGLKGVETPAKILQSYIVGPHELHFHVVHHLLREHLKEVMDYKVIVFCTTAMVTAFLYVLLRDLKMNVREMHSRKPQLYRTRISDEFRESKNLILVTSDVSARGMNYPDVTLVIQMGLPLDREQYIHRLGRTGREGKDGKGILLLAPWEEHFMHEIKDLPIEKSKLPELGPDAKQKVEDSIARIDPSIKEAAYHAWLGYYNSISDIGRDKTMLVELANRFSSSIGLDKPPALYRKTALKMGLKDIPGIRIRK